MKNWVVVGFAIAALGCEDTRGSDAGPRDGGELADAGGTDAGGSDAGTSTDAGAIDAGSTDDAGTTGGETCALAFDVTGGGTFGGTTTGATDDYSVSGTNCPLGGSASGPDVAYVLSPATPTNYRITVTPLDAAFDPMLVAMLDCAGAACEAGTVLNTAGEPEEITLAVDAGETVYVVVDGELFTDGPYELSVVIE